MTTSIDEFKHQRAIAQLDADIAQHSTWLKENHPDRSTRHDHRFRA